MSTLIGQTLLDRYFLQELVGSGGMADVFLGWDRIRFSKMAIKVLRRDLNNDPLFLEQFSKEADILRVLEHPNIVRLYEFKQDGDLFFIVMDWVDGSDLRKILKSKKGNISISLISHILESVSSALHYAHENHIYHCDIKPANIMLHTDGRVLLTDFGVAFMAHGAKGGGTPSYMAPEQFTDGNIDARTDVYALGITLYEIFSGGNLPYRGESRESKGTTPRERIEWEHLYLPPPPIRYYNPTISPEVEGVISTAINKKPEKRFNSTLALRDAFEKARIASNNSDKLINIEKNDDINGARVDQSSNSIASRNRLNPVEKPHEPTNRYTPPQPYNHDLGAQISGFIEKLGFSQNKVSEPRLICRSGQYSGQTISIPIGEIILGRGSQSYIKISEGSVSRNHASLIRSKRGVYIRNNSNNLGTYVNGRMINGPVLLMDRDVIQIGYQQIFEFSCR
jgi:serine/threonine protein kinase